MPTASVSPPNLERVTRLRCRETPQRRWIPPDLTCRRFSLVFSSVWNIQRLLFTRGAEVDLKTCSFLHRNVSCSSSLGVFCSNSLWNAVRIPQSATPAHVLNGCSVSERSVTGSVWRCGGEWDGYSVFSTERKALQWIELAFVHEFICSFYG